MRTWVGKPAGTLVSPLIGHYTLCLVALSNQSHSQSGNDYAPQHCTPCCADAAHSRRRENIVTRPQTSMQTANTNKQTINLLNTHTWIPVKHWLDAQHATRNTLSTQTATRQERACMRGWCSKQAGEQRRHAAGQQQAVQTSNNKARGCPSMPDSTHAHKRRHHSAAFKAATTHSKPVVTKHTPALNDAA